MLTKDLIKPLLSFLLIALLSAACAPTAAPADTSPTDTPAAAPDEIPSPSPTPTTDPLVICIGQAPNTLTPYDQPNRAAQQILQAIYPPDIFRSIPSLSDSTAILQKIQVSPGDLVVGDDGQPRALAPGLRVRPAGCRSSQCALVYNGGSIQMDTLTVTFQLKPGLAWADGAPLTASDSVFAFNLAAQNPVPDQPYTAAYQAPDDTTLIWQGLPGYLPQDYSTQFWPPLPEHLLGALPPADLPGQLPLGYGPFTVSSWSEEQIILDRNTYSPTPPRAGRVIFMIVGQDDQTGLQSLLDGDCHILTPDALAKVPSVQLEQLQSQGVLQTAAADGYAWEAIYFGLSPRTYDNGYQQISGDRPNFFGDVRTRQAVAHCLDRQSISAQLGGGAVMHSYAPSSDPAIPTYPYDPAAGTALLEEVGWQPGPEGVRQAADITDILNETPFQISYRYPVSAYNQVIAEAVAQNLGDCGIAVNLDPLPPEQFFATGPQSPVFSRDFDLAHLSWQTGPELCYLFLTEAIPGADLAEHPYSWGGWNPSGWSHPDFDTACRSAQSALPGESAYTQNHLLAQEFFSQELPAIPLFTHQQAAAAGPNICGLSLDPTAGLLVNFQTLGFGEQCLDR